MASKSPESVKKVKDPVSVPMSPLSKCESIAKVFTNSRWMSASMRSSRSIVLLTFISTLKNRTIILTCSWRCETRVKLLMALTMMKSWGTVITRLNSHQRLMTNWRQSPILPRINGTFPKQATRKSDGLQKYYHFDSAKNSGKFSICAQERRLCLNSLRGQLLHDAPRLPI